LTPEEKKLYKHRINTNPGESEALLSNFTLVSNRSALWYEEVNKDETHTEAVCLETYAFRDNRWKGENDYLNHEAFYVLCRYNGWLWRCKDFKEIAILRKAIKKDFPIRYPDMKWMH
jgi:hypothetical protein